MNYQVFSQVVRQLWTYIREKNLQDPGDRRNINCDEPLQALFGVDSINMFQMNKALSRHIWPLDSEDGDSCPLFFLYNNFHIAVALDVGCEA